MSDGGVGLREEGAGRESHLSKEDGMNGTDVDPRVVADALQMDTHDLTKLLCTFSSDALPVGTWLERSYRPMPLEDFDEGCASARRHLEAAHAAWTSWNQENPEYADVAEDGQE